MPGVIIVHCLYSGAEFGFFYEEERKELSDLTTRRGKGRMSKNIFGTIQNVQSDEHFSSSAYVSSFVSSPPA
jgi:hypothetical protein